MKVQRPVCKDVGLEQSETVRVHFYVLEDPNTNEIRYVGQTVNPENRFRNHIWESKEKNVTHKHRWVVSLLRRNQQPIMRVIGSALINSISANRIEGALIKRYGKKCRLTNLIDRSRNQSVIVTKPVSQYTMQGEFIARYPNANQAAIAIAGQDAAITTVCRNPNGRGNRSRYGFLWAYDGEVPIAVSVDYRRLVTAKQVIQLDLEGNKLNEFASCRMASEVTSVCYKRISACLNGRQHTAGGFKWLFSVVH